MFTNQNWKRGDPNQDGEINAADALLVLQHSVELIQLNAVQQAVTDVDASGSLNALDALYILQHSVGLTRID